ncbi:MAG: SMP-30/gluconolactonase/LRE family protein [Bacteroidia bacterium]|nr:SMP-30/gluconolactonase/LRE family protein [Bacteroidia bacterium]
MNIMQRTFSFLALLFLLSCGQLLAQNGYAVPVGPGPEDMVLDTLTGAPRLIIACTQRRKGEPYSAEFYALNIGEKEAKILPRTGEPEGWKIHLHGLDIVRNNEGKNLIYAISHGLSEDDPTQYILIYEVFADHLELIHFLGDPEHLLSPNDVTATPDGRIYAGNDFGYGFGMIVKFLTGAKSSSIVMYKDGKWSFVADKLRYANGIRVQGDRLYCATTAGGKVWKWNIDPNGNLVDRELLVEGLQGLDNLDFVDENTLIVPRHPENGKFLKHRKEPEALSPSWIYTVDIANKDYKRIFMDDGNNISACSTAILFEGKLYLCQVFNGFVYVADTDVR